MIRFVVVLMAAMMLVSACSKAPAKRDTQWQGYYAKLDTPRAHVHVVPPEGTTVPMAKLIAEHVVEQLQKEKISAQISDGRLGKGRHFVLTGMAERIENDPRVKYDRVLRWMLSDAGGRLISTYTHGIEGTQQEWDFGDAQLLASIAIGTAGPVSQMVLQETKSTVPTDPLRRGLLVEQVAGLSPQDSAFVTKAVSTALRTSDVLVTGDPRQASFRLAGRVEVTESDPGFVNIRIVWRVLTMDQREIGSAVQDNRLAQTQLQGGWAEFAPAIGKAAAVGVEHVFGTRRGPAPGSANRAKGEPPAIVLPGQPGRAMPPPQ
ncbi:MAG: hypothetical protein OQK24_03370 [Magnetovibrio sp.]|nr:hypothetical protein [Magnetovibrio sp.]